MKLTAYTDYSVRLLMYLAVNKNRLCTIKEVATAYNISKNHLMKLAFELGKAGFIETVRGRSGGMRLNRAPQDISIGELIRFTEAKLHLAECFEPGSEACNIAAVCRLRGAFREAHDAFLGVLDDYTLADLVPARGGVTKILKVA